MSEDTLLRQLQRLAVAVARRLTGRRGEEDIEGECEAAAGLSLDVAERLPTEALLRLVSSPEGLDAHRAFALGLGLLARSAATAGDRRTPQERSSLETRAVELLAAATSVDPGLMTDALRDALAGWMTEG